MKRIYEHQTDAIFTNAFESNPDFSETFLSLIDGDPENGIRTLETQTPHRAPGHRGTIDLEITRSDNSVLLIENKIDAAYSVTSAGDAQPERYCASVTALRGSGHRAASVLLAPDVYLRGTRQKDAFDHLVSYESLRPSLAGAERVLLDEAIVQAATPYEPSPNTFSAGFFADFEAYSSQHFPELVIKHNPNGNGVRPTGSRTIYFDVPRTLRTWAHLPRPRMSLQCRDSAAPSASVKIMLGGLGRQAQNMRVPESLSAIGGYIRPAGRSLGLAVDTPQLDTQMSFDAQRSAVDEGLVAARRLAAWWNEHARSLEFQSKGDTT